MSDERKETPDILGDIMGDVMGSKKRQPGLPKKPAAQPTKTPAERLARRATYDISAGLKKAIAARATRLGVPASQLAHFLLLDAWQRLERGEIDPEPFLVESDSPAYRNRLAVEEAYPNVD